MNREEIVRKILDLSPQTGLLGTTPQAYAGAETAALAALLQQLERVANHGRALREAQQVPLESLQARVDAVRAQRDAVVERLARRLAQASAAPSTLDDERAGFHAATEHRKASYAALMRQRAALEQQINAARSRERPEAVAKIRQLVADYGLTAADLTAIGRRAGAAATAVVDPKTGKTWSGRGRPPKWVTEADLPVQAPRS